MEDQITNQKAKQASLRENISGFEAKSEELVMLLRTSAIHYLEIGHNVIYDGTFKCAPKWKDAETKKRIYHKTFKPAPNWKGSDQSNIPLPKNKTSLLTLQKSRPYKMWS
eukprot:194287_1